MALAENVEYLQRHRQQQQRDRRPRRPAAGAPGIEGAAEYQHEKREAGEPRDGPVRQYRLKHERPDQQRQQEAPSPAGDKAKVGVDDRHGAPSKGIRHCDVNAAGGHVSSLERLPRQPRTPVPGSPGEPGDSIREPARRRRHAERSDPDLPRRRRTSTASPSTRSSPTWSSG